MPDVLPECGSEDQEKPHMHDYTGDDYDRVGCSVVIDVHNGHIVMKVYPPGRREEPPIEVFGARSPDGVAIALFDWLSGRVPRRHYAG